MKISIIIPVYNVEDYIVDCLESVAKQTFDGEIECLIIDDCGTDKSVAIAESFIETYNGSVNFAILKREKNGGLSAARNTGTDAATGDYIFYLDSDDMITSDCVAKMAETACHFPDAGLIQGGIVNLEGMMIYDINTKDLPDFSTDIKWIKTELMMPQRLPVSSWNKLIKREIIEKNHIRFIEGIIHEDVPFAFHLAQVIRCIAFCKENTYIYRSQRTGSILNSSSIERSYMSRMKAYQYCIEHTDEIGKHIQIYSVLQRLHYALQTKPKTDIANIETRKLYSAILQNAPSKIKKRLTLFFSLPWRVQRSKTVFNFLFHVNNI